MAMGAQGFGLRLCLVQQCLLLLHLLGTQCRAKEELHLRQWGRGEGGGGISVGLATQQACSSQLTC